MPSRLHATFGSEAAAASGAARRNVREEERIMAENFNVGDVVKLKSGGPSMTVTAVGDLHGMPSVWCSWFVDLKNEQGSFPPDAVVLVKGE